MIVVSAGMQRAGTRWYYNLTNDLAIAAGYPDARAIRERYNLQSILNTVNCNMRRLHRRELMKLEHVSRETDTFTVKTHRRPSPSLRRLLESGRFKATYICRDLRDVIVSGLERGEKLRSDDDARRYFLIGPYRTFARLHTVKGAILWARWQLMPRWEAWMRCPGTLVTRYEDLVVDTPGQLERLARHLEWNVSDQQIEEVAAKYQRDRVEQGAIEKPRFMNKGIVGRYKEVFSPAEQDLCRKRLGRYLERMGYLS